MADSTALVTRLDEHDTLEDRLRVHRTEGAKFWAKNWEEATHFQRFANGAEHWPAGDLARVGKSPNRAARLTFDRIAPILQTLGGRQIMQRHERAYLPRHPDAARQAEIITAVDRAMMSAADADQVESTAFKDGCGVQGLACVRWELDTLKERGGGILLSELPIWQVMADPEARGINLSDRAWHRYGRWMPQTEVRDRWPDEWETIRSNVGGASYVPQEEGTSSRIPWAGMAGNKPAEWYYPRGKSLWIEYEEWREKVTRWEVAQPADPTMSYAEALAPGAVAPAGEDGAPGGGDPIVVVTYETSAELRAFKKRHRETFDEAVPRDMVVARDEVQYKYAYICGDTTLETDTLPTGYWTIQFLTGFRYPLANEVRWKSLVSRLIDPQKWIDVMVSALIRNLQMSPKGLLFVEEGFFRNRNEALSAWAAPGGVIQVRRGGLTAGTPGYKWESGGSNPYTGMVESLLQMYRDLIPELAGFNPGALGQFGGDLRRISGEVVRQVQDAAMTSNAELFDALRLHRREGGRIFLSFLRTFFEVDDIIRIVGEDVAYETVMEPATAPVMDPATGQPQVGEDGQPVMQPLIDEVTGQPQMRPAMDPATGEAVRRLVVPEKSMWTADSWKEIAVEDVVPSGDQLQSLWKALETSIQILLQPQPDTGLPLFTSDILTEIIPGIPAQVREKMRQQIKAAKLRTAMAAMQPQQPAAGGEAGGGAGAGGAEATGYTNGQGGG